MTITKNRRDKPAAEATVIHKEFSIDRDVVWGGEDARVSQQRSDFRVAVKKNHFLNGTIHRCTLY